MNDDSPQIRRLTRWNRFWLVMIVFYTLVSACSYIGHRFIAYATRLQLRWDDNVTAKGQGALMLSSSGGPYIVTHLATGGSEIDPALAAIAQLPHPLLLRPKSYIALSTSQLAKLTWINSEGKKVAPPKPNDPVMALYSEAQKVMTTE